MNNTRTTPATIDGHLLKACKNALREFHCSDGDDEECGAISALKDAIDKAESR